MDQAAEDGDTFVNSIGINWKPDEPLNHDILNHVIS